MSAALIARYAGAERQAHGDQVAAHMTLVTRIARHIHARLPAHVDVDDLVQAGMVGLLEAVAQYDPRHDAGASLATFAGMRIRGAIIDEVRRNGWAPRSVQRSTRELAAAIHAVEQREGHAASASEVASEMSLDLDSYHQVVAAAARSQVLALESFSNDEGEVMDIEGDTPPPEERLQQQEFRQALAANIANLPERERMVMALYYQEELTLKEIGAVLGVSESRVCQLHGQALVRLRARLGEWLPDATEE